MEILLANPRGFCAGVDRAISIVEVLLQRLGAPVYVKHEIVHNRYVVNDLKRKGAIFVEELDQVPPQSVLVFSAHGVSQWRGVWLRAHDVGRDRRQTRHQFCGTRCAEDERQGSF